MLILTSKIIIIVKYLRKELPILETKIKTENNCKEECIYY